MSEEMTKLMFIFKNGPHGDIQAYEGLEFVLITAAYEQDVTLAFVGDGVLALKKDQDTAELGIKGFMKTWRTLEDYDVEKLYVDKQSMDERGLTPDDLIVPVEVKDAAEIKAVMNEQHVIYPF